MTEFTKEDTVVAVDDCLETTIEGETILLHRGAGTYYGLRGTGTRVWELVQEPIEVAKIQETILNEYDVSREACERDVVTYLQDLAAGNLLNRVEEHDS